MYILLNGVNAYLTFGTGFLFFHFFLPFYVVCFSFVILRGTVFSGTHPCQRVSRDTIRVYTLVRAMLFMCIRDRLFRNTDAGDKREIEKRQLYTDSGTVVICNTCTHTYNTHAYTCKAIQAIHTKKKLYEYNVCS